MTKLAKKDIDMVNGPLIGGLLRFSIPIIATGVLQLLYNAADIAVVGRYAGDVALSAVSSTGSLINLILNLCIGLSVGANVIVARMLGAKNKAGVHRAVHTAILLSLICGLIAGCIGFLFSRNFLSMMGSPDDVIDLSTIYMKIYFLGTPANMLYNFGASVLRAAGDTRRPLIFLATSGLVNVGLNLLLVIVFDMSVVGVAIGTITSQVLSAILVTIVLVREKSDIKLHITKLRIYKKELINIIKVGIPSGLQSALFSISNVVIQSSYNSFGSTAMGGVGVGSNIEGFVYAICNSIYQATLTFVSKNYGAGNYKRINKLLISCVTLVGLIGLVVGNLAIIFGRQLAGLYSTDTAVIEIAVERLRVLCTLYFLCGFMEVGSGMLRGIDHSVYPMVVCVIGVCGFRMLWVFTVFRKYHTLAALFVSYPISWFITASVLFIGYGIFYKKMMKSHSLNAKTDLATK